MGMDIKVRAWAITLGVGLVILFLAGLGSATGVGWLTWLDGVAAICSFVVAANVDDHSPVRDRAGSTGAIAVGLFALWIIALVSSAVPPWQAWWNFAFACAYGLVALGTSYGERMTTVHRTDQDRFQRSA